MLRIKLIIKYCVSCCITYILQNDTRSIQYQNVNIINEEEKNQSPMYLFKTNELQWTNVNTNSIHTVSFNVRRAHT